MRENSSIAGKLVRVSAIVISVVITVWAADKAYNLIHEDTSWAERQVGLSYILGLVFAIVFITYLIYNLLNVKSTSTLEDSNEYKNIAAEYEKKLFLIRKQIEERIDRLIRRSTLMLSLALVVAGVGILLFFYLSSRQESNSNTTTLISRFGMTVIIETLAIFFLNAHNKIRNEIAYESKERNIILLKSSALDIVLKGDRIELDKDEQMVLVDKIVSRFIAEENNFHVHDGKISDTTELQRNNIRSTIEDFERLSSLFKNNKRS